MGEIYSVSWHKSCVDNSRACLGLLVIDLGFLGLILSWLVIIRIDTLLCTQTERATSLITCPVKRATRY